MVLLLSEIFDLVDKAKTREEKIFLLKRHEMPVVRGILKINFHPDTLMDLPEGEPPYRKEGGKPIGYQETNLITEYRRFYIWLDPKQNLPKVRKEKLFIEMLEGLHTSEAELICLAKDKKIQKKWKTIKEDLVREAYPMILPPIVKKEIDIPLS
jgi:hypothetical protein